MNYNRNTPKTEAFGSFALDTSQKAKQALWNNWINGNPSLEVIESKVEQNLQIKQFSRTLLHQVVIVSSHPLAPFVELQRVSWRQNLSLFTKRYKYHIDINGIHLHTQWSTTLIRRHWWFSKCWHHRAVVLHNSFLIFFPSPLLMVVFHLWIVIDEIKRSRANQLLWVVYW